MSYTPHLSRQRWTNLALAGLFMALALVTRLRSLDQFITPDEMKWVCRSINFYRGLATGQFGETLQTGHPGVITMWLGTPWMGIDPTTPWLEITRNPSLSDMFKAIPPETRRAVAELLFAARRGVAVLTSLAIGAAFLLLARLFDRRVALVAAGLLVVDPFYLAHSRFLHLDAITTSFLFLSVLSLALALREDRPVFLALSGVMGGVAALNKSPALFGFAFAALVLGMHWLAMRRHLGWMIRRGVWWLAPALLTYVLFWPVMWVQPWRAISTVLGTAFFYASNPHVNFNYFWGAPRADPGPAFYPVALAFRLTPWAVVGSLAGLPWLVRRHTWRNSLWIIAGFALLYMIFMTTGEKKFDRYLLPIFPFVHTIAALGLVRLGGWLAARLRRARLNEFVAPITATLVLTLGALTVLPHAPYYLTYYNPLVGGSRWASYTLLVGWDEGLDQAAAYLNSLPDIAGRTAVARAFPDFAPFYKGLAHDDTDYDPATTEYVVAYLNEVQRRLSPELMERYYDVAQPVHTVRLKGIDYAWVYENQTHEPPMQYIAEHSQAGSDAIVVSRPSLFAERYAGPLPVTVLPEEAGHEELSRLLQEAAGRAKRLWYVQYVDKNPNPMLAWLDFQWRTHAYELDRRSFTDIELTLWQPAEGAPFLNPQPVRQQSDLRFGDALRLRGYTLMTDTAQWGRALGIELEWEVLRDLDQYYAVFVHLVDEGDHRWGHGDQWMVNEALLPTVNWKRGEIVRTYLPIDLGTGIAPGSYTLRVGVYDRVSRAKLAMATASGPVPGQSHPVGQATVSPSPVRVAPDQLKIPHATDLVLVEGLHLLGWAIDSAKPGFGQRLSVALYWQAGSALTDDYQARLQLVDPQGRAWAEGTFALASEEYPTSRWLADEVLWRYDDLRIADKAPATEANLELTLLDSTGQPVGAPVVLTTLPIEGHRFAAPPMSHGQGATLGENIHLLGFDLEPTALKPGATCALTLYWQAEAKPEAGYTVFVHLLGPDGKVYGQRDNAPVEGRYATDHWQPGEVVVDRYEVPLDSAAPAGEYRVEIGMYDPAQNAQRLPLVDARGVRQPDDRLLLDVILRVEP